MLDALTTTPSLTLPSSKINTPIDKRAPLKLADGRVVAYYSLERSHPITLLASAGREVSDFTISKKSSINPVTQQ